jgi:chemotaxis protein methyltransferase CheR
MNWSHAAFEQLTALVATRTGLSFPPERRANAELGIRRAMARAGINDPDRYRSVVSDDKARLDDLIVELAVGETYFYREPGQFEFIRRAILPELRETRSSVNPVRAWSAGCASGEEAYSLAMLSEDEAMGDRVQILATDISRAALDRARNAVYGTWSLRGEGVAAALPHLHRQGSQYAVSEAVRRHVRFEYLNLALDVYPSIATGTWGLDLILCRNVLIYFDRDTVNAVWNRLGESLREGGWLITASSDPLFTEEGFLEKVVTSEGVFCRRPRQLLVSATPSSMSHDRPAQPAARARNGEERQREFQRQLPHAAVPDSSATSLAPGAEPTSMPSSAGTPASAVSPESVLVAAREELARGMYAKVVERTGPLAGNPGACALYVRALANLDLPQAARACSEAVARHPVSTELHYLYAVLLVGLDLDEEAANEARRALYLDRSLAIVHFLLGSVLRRRGDRAGAVRAYRNARVLCELRPSDEILPLSDGEPAGRLAEMARLQLEQLEHAIEGPP